MPITELYAYVIQDKDENDEGIPAFLGEDGMHYPLVGADMDRANNYRGMVQNIADKTGKTIKLIHSTGIEVIDEIKPLPKALLGGHDGDGD